MEAARLLSRFLDHQRILQQFFATAVPEPEKDLLLTGLSLQEEQQEAFVCPDFVCPDFEFRTRYFRSTKPLAILVSTFPNHNQGASIPEKGQARYKWKISKCRQRRVAARFGVPPKGWGGLVIRT